jgi:hypothetical protein
MVFVNDYNYTIVSGAYNGGKSKDFSFSHFKTLEDMFKIKWKDFLMCLVVTADNESQVVDFFRIGAIKIAHFVKMIDNIAKANRATILIIKQKQNCLDCFNYQDTQNVQGSNIKYIQIDKAKDGKRLCKTFDCKSAKGSKVNNRKRVDDYILY